MVLISGQTVDKTGGNCINNCDVKLYEDCHHENTQLSEDIQSVRVQLQQVKHQLEGAAQAQVHITNTGLMIVIFCFRLLLFTNLQKIDTWKYYTLNALKLWVL